MRSVLSMLLATASVAFAVPAFASDADASGAEVMLNQAVLPSWGAGHTADASPLPSQVILARAERSSSADLPVSEPEQPESAIDVILKATLSNGIGYPDQAFTLSDKATLEFELDVASERFGLNIWHAENKDGWLETDFTLSASRQIGTYALGLDGGYYLVPDSKEIWEAKVYLSRPITDRCEGTISAEVMRGGFVTEVARGELSCEFPLSETVSVDMLPSVSYDTSIDAASLGYDFGLTYQVTDEVAVRAFVNGYAGSVGNDTFVGLSLTAF